MKNLILTLLATALGLMTMAQVGTIENITVEQRADGSGMVELSFDLTGPETAQYNISIEASFDGGDTYKPVDSEHLGGDIAGVSPATGIEIVWDGMASHPDIYTEEAMLKIVASHVEDNGNGDEPGTVTDIDGNVYNTVIIGNQEWMAENLKTTKYRNGTPIEYPGTDNTAWENNTTGAYAWYDNDIGWKNSYGALYNWHAVNNSNGLCPTGWHLPSDAEWTELVDYVAEQGYPNSDLVNGAGNALKSCRQVSSPLGGDCATLEHPRWNSHSTHYGIDEFGFSALPGGRRTASGWCDSIGNRGSWWSSSEFSSTLAWDRSLTSHVGSVSPYGQNKGFGFSVRCVKDSDVPPVHSLNLQVYPEGGGEVVGAGDYLEGTLVSISVSPNPGHTFVNWSGDTNYIADANSDSTTLTMPGQDVNLTANFEEDDGGNIEPGEGVTDIDGNFYPSVIIGNQEWMAENLKTTKYRNGTPIEYPGTDNTAWENNTTGAYAWYDNDIGWKDSYGALYNWHAVNNSNGLCPTGWHVSSDAEWQELVGYVVEQGYPNSDVVNGAGNALKSCRQVSSPLGGDCATSEHPRWNSHSTHYGIDEYGFSALPGGRRYTDGTYTDFGSLGSWWTSTELIPVYAWGSNLYHGAGVVHPDYERGGLGFSVRCVKDSDVPPVHSLNLQVYPEGGGEVVGAGDYLEGTLVSISVSLNPGHTFVNWSGDINYIADANSDSTTLTMPSQDVNLTANFEEDDGGNIEPGEGVTDIDGNFYPSVIIGNQEWMAENLKTTKFADGSAIDFGINIDSDENTPTPAYAIYNHPIDGLTSDEIFNMFGTLYNWPAVNDPRGLCPAGWQVPDLTDWNQLINHLTSNYELHNDMYSSDVSGVGNALKSCRQVNSPLGGNCNTTQHPRWNANSTHYGNNLFGFNALPGGTISDLAHSEALESAFWWSATSETTDQAKAWYLFIETGTLVNTSSSKINGLSVRCIKSE